MHGRAASPRWPKGRLELLEDFLEALGESGTSRVFAFKMLSGQAGSAAFWQMLQHMVNHGSYHRGQVTTMLRQLGASPAKSMDIVAFYRENAQ